jgi:hypothetical protein
VGAPLGELFKKNRKEEAGLKKERGKYYSFLNTPRTVLRDFFGILTTPWRTQFSTLEGLLRPKVLASIGLSCSYSQCAVRSATPRAHTPDLYTMQTATSHIQGHQSK